MSTQPGLVILLAALLAGPGVADEPRPNSTTVFGTLNQLLADGADALRKGRYREGIELTLAGLERPNDPRDVAPALSNLCAGFVALHEFATALEKCNAALVSDAQNWHAFNNRAAAYAGLGMYDSALRDVQAGLDLYPNSQTLKTTLRIVRENQRKQKGQQRKATHS